jgi:hypothetical protein
LLTKQLIFITLLLSSAANAQDQGNMPLWLKGKLELYKRSHPDISAQVTEYNGEIAYYIPLRCCDIPSELYDQNGKIICHPNGGFTGGDGKCQSFSPQKKR